MKHPPPIPNSYWLPDRRIAAGEYPGAHSERTALTRLLLVLDSGVNSFVDLTTTQDPLQPYEPMLHDIAARTGAIVSYLRMPIRDMDVPSHSEMLEILDHIAAEVDRGRVVYVHCWGGVGRTGTVVGCWLVRQGVTGDEALRQVTELFRTMSPAKIRSLQGSGSPQTESQREMVRNWSEHEKC